MKETKYIVVALGLMDVIIMFPSAIDHTDMASRMAYRKEDVLSAGFIRLTQTGKWYCYGKSIGLGLQARPVDSEIANRQLPIMDD